MEQKWWAASVRKNTVMIAFNDFDPEFPGFRTVPSWRGFGSSLPCRRETTAQHQMDHTSGVCLHHHSYFAFFHLERFLSAYISEFWIKVCFMSRSFAKPAFSRTVTIDIKQLTTSTQNTFTFQNYLSYFCLWLEKFTELRSNWRSAPPPTAPPSSLKGGYRKFFLFFHKSRWA